MQALRKIVAKLLRDVAFKIDSGTCELSETEALQIVQAMSHLALSKEQACRYLNMSRSKFDFFVKQGKLPKGRKRVGFKELVWFKDELDKK